MISVERNGDTAGEIWARGPFSPGRKERGKIDIKVSFRIENELGVYPRFLRFYLSYTLEFI